MKEITKESYGMSTKKAQTMINPYAKTKTSEGCTKYIKVKDTVKQWTENMCDYLKSAMSYTDKPNLNEFIGKPQLVVNSSCAILAVNKWYKGWSYKGHSFYFIINIVIKIV